MKNCTTCIGCELEDHDWSKGVCKCYIERETGLKPCPFCGGEAELGKRTDAVGNEWFVVNCKNYTQCRRAWSESEAIKAWNTRV